MIHLDTGLFFEPNIACMQMSGIRLNHASYPYLEALPSLMTKRFSCPVY